MKKSSGEWWLLIGLLAVLAYTGGTTIEEVGANMVQAVIDKIAYAIAVAEGFFVPGSRPNRLHNPGDLTRDITGKGVGTDGAYIAYSNDEDGWAALKHQVSLMFSGSHVYNPNMTIAEVASRYTATEQDAWAQNVATQLGVDVNTRLIDIV